MKTKKMKIVILLLGFLLAVPLRHASATVVWEEDFADIDDCDLSYWDDDSGRFIAMNETGFHLQNGVLTAPNDQYTFRYNAMAYHNSTTAYGTWTFDWVINPFHLIPIRLSSMP